MIDKYYFKNYKSAFVIQSGTKCSVESQRLKKRHPYGKTNFMII